ncbi:MAG: ribosome-associated translation inhibitor RaiA [Deltaproteobacteria bacterium]|nr:ribosome-associated translation inhibitor RaiA [Deltaproteobacteria bacterium]
MQPTFTFRNIESTDGLKTHTKEKLDRLQKYSFKPESAHIVLRVEHLDHFAEITFVDHGEHFVSHANSPDMYASIDLAFHRLEAQLRRKKERQTHHKGHTATSSTV